MTMRTAAMTTSVGFAATTARETGTANVAATHKPYSAPLWVAPRLSASVMCAQIWRTSGDWNGAHVFQSLGMKRKNQNTRMPSRKIGKKVQNRPAKVELALPLSAACACAAKGKSRSTTTTADQCLRFMRIKNVRCHLDQRLRRRRERRPADHGGRGVTVECTARSRRPRRWDGPARRLLVGRR